MLKLRPYQQDAFDAIRRSLKQNKEPCIADLSVGAGKTIIISELLRVIEKAGFRALCLTMSSILIHQNSESYKNQGGVFGIYCAGFSKKDTKENIIFASPNSILKGIKSDKNIRDIKFNLIIIDECHNVNHKNNSSMYMKIFNHYGCLAQTNNYSFRIFGLTGTPYRDKNISIIGENEFFKQKVYEISTEFLIENGYLTNPEFGLSDDVYNMRDLNTNALGRFSDKELQDKIDSKKRLTSKIMEQIVSVVDNGRNGAFIFASTVKHAEECMQSLPKDRSVFISGKKQGKKALDEKMEILNRAKKGEIKYLVSVGTLFTGIDVPFFDVCAILRPTESLRILKQAIGRVLRLHDSKKSALILDYAGNFERHGDIDDPIINEAIQKKKYDDHDYCIPCYTCKTLNKVTTRRCIGTKDSKRCDHFFEFRECPSCNTKNDIFARQCRNCDKELIDPNSKLSLLKSESETFEVINAKYWTHEKSGIYIVTAMYNVKNNSHIYENFYLKNQQSINIFYGRFVKQHLNNGGKYYKFLNCQSTLNKILRDPELKTPKSLTCKLNNNGKYDIIKKEFICNTMHTNV